MHWDSFGRRTSARTGPRFGGTVALAVRRQTQLDPGSQCHRKPDDSQGAVRARAVRGLRTEARPPFARDFSDDASDGSAENS